MWERLSAVKYIVDKVHSRAQNPTNYKLLSRRSTQFVCFADYQWELRRVGDGRREPTSRVAGHVA